MVCATRMVRYELQAISDRWIRGRQARSDWARTGSDWLGLIPVIFGGLCQTLRREEEGSAGRGMQG